MEERFLSCGIYFGPGLTYVGIDINPGIKVSENEQWINIEIGDTSDPLFLAKIREKYPHVDVFLDDGGHTMKEQMTAIREMLPHVQPEGVYACEGLDTSWSERHGGVPNADARDQRFLDKTAFGLVHKTLDWFMSGWIRGDAGKHTELSDDYFPESWWRVIAEQVKHIHLYNQVVVYEKGIINKPRRVRTVGSWIPMYSKSVSNRKVDWEHVMNRVSALTNSPWNRTK